VCLEWYSLDVCWIRAYNNASAISRHVICVEDSGRDVNSYEDTIATSHQKALYHATTDVFLSSAYQHQRFVGTAEA
jgi:hypothetical protein